MNASTQKGIKAWSAGLALLLLAGMAAALARQSQSTPSAKARQSVKKSRTAGSPTEAVRLNNLGVAYMNQQQSERALKLFEQAFALDLKLYTARLNQGIALMNVQRYDAARAILLEATQRQPKNPRAWFNLGLLYKTLGQAPPALDAFQHVSALDPDDPDTHYFIGLLHAQLQQYAQAIAAYQRALTLNRFHVSAEFGLAQAYQRSGDSAQAKEHLARFQKLNEEKLGAPVSLIYGEQGKYSFAEEAAPPANPVPPPIPVRFVEANAGAGLPARAGAASPGAAKTVASFLGSGACFFDYDGDGRPDLFLVDADGSGAAALYHNAGDGRFVDVTKAASLQIRGQGMGCTAGDYDNDGHTDLAVSFNGRVALYHNQGDGTFRDVTQDAGIRVDGLALGVTFVDYDHDGDLDLYVSRFTNFALENPAQPFGFPFTDATASARQNILWRNNGNGSFTDVTQETGLGNGAPGVAALASDINNDRAIDFVLTGWQKAPAIYLNPREGRFKAIQPWSVAMNAPAAGVVAFDFDKDGWMDLAFTHWGAPGLSLWRNVEGKRFEPVPLPKLDWTRGWGLAAIDYDNDGWMDLVAVGENAQGAQIALLRNEGPRGFRNVTTQVALDRVKLHDPRAIIAADYDGDGDTDLLITQHGGPPVLLRNDGGNRNHSLHIALKGDHDNKSAIGTKVEVFAGTSHQKWEVAAASGYLGQSSTDIEAGLGTRQQADVVRLLWPTGVLQDEIDLTARNIQNINEINRRGSSCPILFAWNGTRYEFIADIIGPGIVGHWIGPGQRNIPDPDEYLKVAGSQARVRNNRLSFRMIEPMEELDYLDQVRLVAVDHPADIDVYPNEYFASNPPFPEFKVVGSRGAHPPLGAWDGAGRNVLPQLLHSDRQYVTGFTDTPFQGLAELHHLELDLGTWDASRPLRLLLHGFTDYFTANSMYAAYQAGIQPIAPYVEALDPAGRWVRVMDDMGFPAGLARTMVADLTGRLPRGTRRIRISTNLKIYWDRILVDNTAPDAAHRLSEVPLAAAQLAFRGYPRVVEGNPLNDLTYIYEDASPTGPYAHQAGNYTRYGDVRELLEAADDRYVIFGSGDEVAVEFDASQLTALPPGWTRDYFFYANGFAKDMDFYAAHGDTVAPLPFHTLTPYPYPPGVVYPEDDRYLQYLLDYNTRAVSGIPNGPFRFQYHR